MRVHLLVSTFVVMLLSACTLHEKESFFGSGDAYRIHDTHGVVMLLEKCMPDTKRLNCFMARFSTTHERHLTVAWNDSSYTAPDGQKSPLLDLRLQSGLQEKDAGHQYVTVQFVPAAWYTSNDPTKIMTTLRPIPHAKQEVTLVYLVDGQRFVESFNFEINWKLQAPSSCHNWIC